MVVKTGYLVLTDSFLLLYHRKRGKAVKMAHKFDPRNKKKLFSAVRRKALPAKDTLQRFGLENGMVMADIGCGNGYFSLAASEIVGPSGRILAFDISAEMIADLKEKIKKEGIENIEATISKENKMPPADAAADLAFLCNVLHEAADIDRFITETARILKEKGQIVVIDWEKTETKFGPPQDRRLDKADAAKLLAEHGFASIRVTSMSNDFYAVCASKQT
jgi:ubiquinone/menaquinone biosynthesis C-methylase UbiE